MGTIICQSCDSTLGYFEDEKVSVLYSHDHTCNHCDTEENNE